MKKNNDLSQLKLCSRFSRLQSGYETRKVELKNTKRPNST